VIRSELIEGLAFGIQADGDGRSDGDGRREIASELNITQEWATINQVHGADILWTDAAGVVGDADGLATTAHDLPLAVRTADCVPVALESDASIGIVHAGWRGVAAGVVPAMVAAMRTDGHQPVRVSIGPHIGPCCFEVGEEVVEAIGGYRDVTRLGSTSVNLKEAILDQLPDIDVESTDVCTFDDPRFASFRRDATSLRQVTVVWRS
jgi:YfiH family protein